MGDILLLESGNEYFCRVHHYSISHSQLYIKLYRNKEIKHLIFGSVKYFSGPMSWKGANFVAGSQRELKNLLHKSTHYPDNINFDTFLDLYHLYIVHTTDTEIKIIAAGGVVSDQEPVLIK